MLIVCSASIIALLLTYLESHRNMKGGLWWGFFIVTLLACIHYDYGNDYMPYYNLFYEITKYPFSLDILNEDVYRDPGWTLLCYIFKHIGGFFMMVAALSIIQNICIYKFIKSEVEKTWWPMAVFTYLFCTSFYLLNLSMLRQAFIVCVFLGLWSSIKNRKWITSLLVLVGCSFIHSSALVLLPFAFWGFIPAKKGRFLALISVVLLMLLWVNDSLIENILSQFMRIEEFKGYAGTYEEIRGGDELTLGLGFIINMIPFILSVLFLWRRDTSAMDKLLVFLANIGFMVTPFSQVIPMASRVGIYFGIYRIAALPIIYKAISNKWIRLVLILLFLFITLYDYYLFFNQGSFAEKYREFHTIFSVHNV